MRDCLKNNQWEKGCNGMKRKVIALILSVATMSIMLTGCGGSQKESGENQEAQTEEISTETGGTVTLKVWGATDDQELLAEMVESFKAKYAGEAEFDITIEAVEEADCRKILLADVTNGADVFSFADDQLLQMVAGGALTPVENAEEVKKANVEGSVAAASVNDTLYAYPMTADNGYFMYYDKSVFSESDLASFDQMLNVAAAANKKVTMDWTSGYYIFSFFGNTGLTLKMNDDGVTMHCDWNTTEGEIKGIDIAHAMQQIALHPGFLNTSDAGLVEGAKNGTVAAGISGVWSANSLKQAWGSNYAAIKLPTYTCAGKQIQMASFSGYKMVGVNAYSKHKDWSLKLADWLTNEENQNLRFAKRGLGPSNINASNTDEVQSEPAIKAVLSQTEFATLQRVSGKYWEPMQQFGITMSSGSQDIVLQELMDETVAAITASAAN